MRQPRQAVVQREISDAMLVAQARAGEHDAVEELYRRHVEAAWRVALAVTCNPHDAADAVSDAFTRVFQALPDRNLGADGFRPYLLAATRNAAIDLLRRGGRQGAGGPGDEVEDPARDHEPSEHLMAKVDAALVARAFRSLPERWRSVLWLTEVEGIPAREVAGLMGVSANGVAQLAVRARAGLRQRYLQAHLGHGSVLDGCRDTVLRLGAYAAGGLAPRDLSKVDQHLAGCGECRTRLQDLHDFAPNLRRVALPLPAILAALGAHHWQVAGTGAATATASATATAAGPTTLGLSAAAVSVPAPLVSSVASVALVVAGVVGVGVGVSAARQPQRASPAVATAAQTPAPAAAGSSVSFAAASSPDAGAQAAAATQDPTAAGLAATAGTVNDLVAAVPRAARDLLALAGSLPSLVPGADPATLEALRKGEVGVDGALRLDADLERGAACPSAEVLHLTIDCDAAAQMAEDVVATATQAADSVLAPPAGG